MLIKKEILDAIKSGEITQQFRSWKRPTVKTGGTLRTAVGMLAIDSVEPVNRDQFTEKDAYEAGFQNLENLLDSLRDGDDRQLYRICLSYAGPDPRKKLRQDDDLTGEELEEIAQKLKRIDDRSRSDPWTHKVLEVIERNPGKPATELADYLDVKKSWLKRNIRKLKELGLTISLSPGYQLSPRGKVVFEFIKKRV